MLSAVSRVGVAQTKRDPECGSLSNTVSKVPPINFPESRSNSQQSVSSGSDPAGRPQLPTALVTGGAGFLGSHLVDKLLSMGRRVIALDNLQTGSMENIERFEDNPSFSFVKHDVIDPYSFEAARIYNLACAASPPRYQKDPLHTFKTNIFGALNAVEAAKKRQARILQASTSEVYGEPLVHPQSEGYWGNVNPVGLRSCYDEGKRGAETVLSDSQRSFGSDVRIARIFNTYGPRMQPDDGRVVSNFIVQALQNKNLTIYGDGSQTRSFCYVDDLIDGLIALMEHNGKAGAPVNLGNPEEFTMMALAELILELTGSRSKIDYRELPADDPTQRKPDITRAGVLLGWQPSTTLVEGLKPTIAYFDALLSKDRIMSRAVA